MSASFNDIIKSINSALFTTNGLIKDGRYQRRIHEKTDGQNTVTYIGYSNRAAVESENTWTIKRITEKLNGITDLDFSEDVAWTNRETVEYQ